MSYWFAAWLKTRRFVGDPPLLCETTVEQLGPSDVALKNGDCLAHGRKTSDFLINVEVWIGNVEYADPKQMGEVRVCFCRHVEFVQCLFQVIATCLSKRMVASEKMVWCFRTAVAGWTNWVSSGFLHMQKFIQREPLVDILLDSGLVWTSKSINGKSKGCPVNVVTCCFRQCKFVDQIFSIGW